jgi:hypothetical protein
MIEDIALLVFLFFAGFFATIAIYQHQTIGRLEAEIDRLVPDATRYRWMILKSPDPDEAQSQIDAAIQKEWPNGG